jgi:pimeloyl-ACP methyl ester carboxylesterase
MGLRLFSAFCEPKAHAPRAQKFSVPQLSRHPLYAKQSQRSLKMKRNFLIFVFPFLIGFTLLSAQTQYGSNKEVGKYEQVNDIKMYYEVYGQGHPLLLISGNSGSIKEWRNQIPFLSKKYKVLTADSRAQGRSYDSDKEITYSLMASDYNELLNKLDLDSVYVFGWSDGGIIGLDLAMNYPSKVKKLIVAGANFKYDTTALSLELIRMIENIKLTPFDKLPETFKEAYTVLTPQPERAPIVFNKLTDLMLKYPDYSVKDISKINAPTLVIAGDHDLIRDEHTIILFQSIPHSQLLILPGTSHLGAWEKPDLVNQMVDLFLSTPYKDLDRYYFLK